MLRSLGFGYRAKYVHECAHQVVERGGEEWLQSLKRMEYKGTPRTTCLQLALEHCGIV